MVICQSVLSIFFISVAYAECIKKSRYTLLQYNLHSCGFRNVPKTQQWSWFIQQ